MLVSALLIVWKSYSSGGFSKISVFIELKCRLCVNVHFFSKKTYVCVCMRVCVWTGSEMFPQHIWLKWWARYRALLTPDNDPFIWIRCVWAGESLKHAGKRASGTRTEKHCRRVYQPVKRLMWKMNCCCVVCVHAWYLWHLGRTFHKILYKSVGLFASYVIFFVVVVLTSLYHSEYLESNPLAVKTVQETTEMKLQFCGVPVCTPFMWQRNTGKEDFLTSPLWGTQPHS